MSSKMGRPTDNPKIEKTMVRLSKEDMMMLEHCASVTGKSKAAIIRTGIKIVYDSLKNK